MPKAPSEQDSAPESPPRRAEAHIRFRNFSFYYGQKAALKNLDLTIAPTGVTSVIGPSGCGKTTLLRCINRMNDLIEHVRYEGDILLEENSIFDPRTEVIALRKRVGMVFQQPNPFPKSIYENIVYSLRVSGVKDKATLDKVVIESLQQAALWEEAKDRLHENALKLSGGQMQRLCIARAIANKPDVILMDEPCSALDPTATGRIEELIYQLKERYTIVIVTHNMQQAARVSDRTAFLYLGSLVEYGDTEDVFFNPQHPETEAYITGRFG